MATTSNSPPLGQSGPSKAKKKERERGRHPTGSTRRRIQIFNKNQIIISRREAQKKKKELYKDTYTDRYVTIYTGVHTEIKREVRDTDRYTRIDKLATTRRKL